MSDDLGAVGERAALARIIPRLRRAQALLGPGDDAALLAAPDGRVLLSTDAMIEGPDFRRAWSTPYELGWKAMATNLADIAAMGGRPTGLLVALAAPERTSVAELEAIADGMAAACDALAPGVGVVGGDLTRAPILSLSVTVTGSLDGRSPVLRSGARPGDLVAYSGRLGLAAAALRLLFAVGEEDASGIAALRRGRPELLREQLAPSPPIRDGVRAAEAGATAMLDVSDGLLLDASRIAGASRVALDLDGAALERLAAEVVAALPADEEDAPRPGRHEALALVLGGGEDHGLLATFPDEPPAGFLRLGVVREGLPAVLIDGAPVDPTGWDSFAPS
ncbi:thiamine-phosphate kinase [Amnibacterium kyonggiense]|uniref:Thiamine-monophosphate kinase n=1 Tax=Amnibacterium kyonggiense TaxID=595671 RepID=A0A4V3EB95_9MICO|nr:thiamine-phosphate kinase [Amnibacterium kyonggiense]TDS80864.1 thiamine-phosphate kinase [Amnibacterium kyonggiense]